MGNDGRSHGCILAETFPLGSTGTSEWAEAQLLQGKRPEEPEESWTLGG